MKVEKAEKVKMKIPGGNFLKALSSFFEKKKAKGDFSDLPLPSVVGTCV